MARKKLTFEDGMQELEEIVRSLEQGQLPLEESFKAFERATVLKKTLEDMLNECDRRIRLLTQSGEHEMEETDA